MNVAALTPTLIALLRAAVADRPVAGETIPALDAPAWNELLQLAVRHEVAPLVDAGVTAAGAAPPPAVAQRLRQIARGFEIRNDQAWEQLRVVISAFNASGVEVLVLKGALFSLRYYRTPGLRPFGDLDILVQESARVRAAEILGGLGYQHATLAGWDHSQYLENRLWDFVPETGLKLEVHWALTPTASSIQPDIQGLWQRSQEWECPGGRARAFAVEDQIVQHAIHAAKHQFAIPLRQYADLAVILASAPDLDWSGVWRQAEELQAEADLAVCIGVAGELGLVTLPTEVRERVDRTLPASAGLAALARYAVEWPYLSYSYSMVEVMASRSPQSRALAVWRALFPSVADLAARAGKPATLAHLPGLYAGLWLRRGSRLLAGAGAEQPESGPALRAAVELRRLFQDRKAQ